MDFRDYLNVFFIRRFHCIIIAEFITLIYAGVAKLGVPEKWIVEHVKQKEIFSQLPNAKIVASLNSLVEKSQIYPVGPKSYRRVL